MLTADIQNTDPNSFGTDPTFFNVPSSGDISYTPDPSLTLPQSDPSFCIAGETDPLTGDTIAGCGGPGGAAGGGGISDPSTVTTPVSASLWQQVGGTLGAFLGGLTKFGTVPSSVPAGQKRCSNGQVVPNSQACPGTSGASVLGGSSSGMIIVLLAVLLIIVFALRK